MLVDMKFISLGDDDLFINNIERIQIDAHRLVFHMISGSKKVLEFRSYEQAKEYKLSLYAKLGWKYV
jgi:hypothetical protein